MYHLKLSRERLDRYIDGCPWLILLGYSVGGLVWFFGTAGFLTAFTSVWLGGTLGAVDSYRQQRGIWMLALLFLCVAFPFWLLIASFELAAWWRGANAAWPILLDFTVGTHLVGLHCRVLWSVICYNWAAAGVAHDGHDHLP